MDDLKLRLVRPMAPILNWGGMGWEDIPRWKMLILRWWVSKPMTVRDTPIYYGPKWLVRLLLGEPYFRKIKIGPVEMVEHRVKEPMKGILCDIYTPSVDSYS